MNPEKEQTRTIDIRPELDKFKEDKFKAENAFKEYDLRRVSLRKSLDANLVDAAFSAVSSDGQRKTREEKDREIASLANEIKIKKDALTKALEIEQLAREKEDKEKKLKEVEEKAKLEKEKLNQENAEKRRLEEEEKKKKEELSNLLERKKRDDIDVLIAQKKLNELATKIHESIKKIETLKQDISSISTLEKTEYDDVIEKLKVAYNGELITLADAQFALDNAKTVAQQIADVLKTDVVNLDKPNVEDALRHNINEFVIRKSKLKEAQVLVDTSTPHNKELKGGRDGKEGKDKEKKRVTEDEKKAVFIEKRLRLKKFLEEHPNGLAGTTLQEKSRFYQDYLQKASDEVLSDGSYSFEMQQAMSDLLNGTTRAEFKEGVIKAKIQYEELKNKASRTPEEDVKFENAAEFIKDYQGTPIDALFVLAERDPQKYDAVLRDALGSLTSQVESYYSEKIYGTKIKSAQKYLLEKNSDLRRTTDVDTAKLRVEDIFKIANNFKNETMREQLNISDDVWEGGKDASGKRTNGIKKIIDDVERLSAGLNSSSTDTDLLALKAAAQRLTDALKPYCSSETARVMPERDRNDLIKNPRSIQEFLTAVASRVDPQWRVGGDKELISKEGEVRVGNLVAYVRDRLVYERNQNPEGNIDVKMPMSELSGGEGRSLIGYVLGNAGIPLWLEEKNQIIMEVNEETGEFVPKVQKMVSKEEKYENLKKALFKESWLFTVQHERAAAIKKNLPSPDKLASTMQGLLYRSKLTDESRLIEVIMKMQSTEREAGETLSPLEQEWMGFGKNVNEGVVGTGFRAGLGTLTYLWAIAGKEESREAGWNKKGDGVVFEEGIENPFDKMLGDKGMPEFYNSILKSVIVEHMKKDLQAGKLKIGEVPLVITDDTLLYERGVEGVKDWEKTDQILDHIEKAHGDGKDGNPDWLEKLFDTEDKRNVFFESYIKGGIAKNAKNDFVKKLLNDSTMTEAEAGKRVQLVSLAIFPTELQEIEEKFKMSAAEEALKDGISPDEYLNRKMRQLTQELSTVSMQERNDLQNLYNEKEKKARQTLEGMKKLNPSINETKEAIARKNAVVMLMSSLGGLKHDSLNIYKEKQPSEAVVNMFWKAMTDAIKKEHDIVEGEAEYAMEHVKMWEHLSGASTWADVAAAAFNGHTKLVKGEYEDKSREGARTAGLDMQKTAIRRLMDTYFNTINVSVDGGGQIPLQNILQGGAANKKGEYIFAGGKDIGVKRNQLNGHTFAIKMNAEEGYADTSYSRAAQVYDQFESPVEWTSAFDTDPFDGSLVFNDAKATALMERYKSMRYLYDNSGREWNANTIAYHPREKLTYNEKTKKFDIERRLVAGQKTLGEATFDDEIFKLFNDFRKADGELDKSGKPYVGHSLKSDEVKLSQAVLGYMVAKDIQAARDPQDPRRWITTAEVYRLGQFFSKIPLESYIEKKDGKSIVRINKSLFGKDRWKSVLSEAGIDMKTEDRKEIGLTFAYIFWVFFSSLDTKLLKDFTREIGKVE